MRRERERKVEKREFQRERKREFLVREWNHHHLLISGMRMEFLE